MKNYPDWIRRAKEKNTEIRKLGNSYYLYQISSVWDSKKKRARKITGKFLGKITPTGIVKPKHERVADMLNHMTVKEFGASHTITTSCSDILNLLKIHFPSAWQEITVFAIERLFHSSPLKNVHHHYLSSYLSNLFPDASVSPKSLSALLNSLGRSRGKLVNFMKSFVVGAEYAVIDLTHVFSLSENVISATLGHNSEKNYTPQINLVLIFSLDQHPAFFRMVPGSIRDISTISTTVMEAGITNAVVIGDKGFTSMPNIEFLESHKLGYILPLKRDSSHIDYSPIRQGDKSKFGGYFFFDKRSIWYYEQQLTNGRRLIVFLDEKLKAEEEKDFLSHVDSKKDAVEKKEAIEEFYQKQFILGTIAIITNRDFSPQRVFELLKSRVEIEVIFDAFKNVLEADRTYMRDDFHLQGWMFINFVSLLLYYRLYQMLLEKDLLKKFSPKDVILHLSRIYKIKCGEKWMLSEIPKTSRILAEKLNIEMPIT